MNTTTMIWRMLLLGGFCLAAADSMAGEAKPFSLTMEYVQRLETRIKMPKGAMPITKYVRYYAVRSVKGQNFVAGIFIGREVGRKPGIRIVEMSKLPYVSDGGCGIIDFVFDIAKNKVTQLACHGEA